MVRREGRNMQLVIDISVVAKVIRKGNPIPKGYGNLKDADTMINKLCTTETSEFFGSVTCAEILDFIHNEKTIIEADKEG